MPYLDKFARASRSALPWLALGLGWSCVPAAFAQSGAPPSKASTVVKGQSSFCTPLETVVFTCRVGAKMVSVCASKNATRDTGYLQYRFGRPDSRDPLEMVLPEAHLAANQAATGESTAYAGGGGSWLRFRKGNYSYVTYSGIGRWGPKGETRSKYGVMVERDGKLIASLKCAAEPDGEMGPDWFEKFDVKPKGDADFFFPD